MTNFCDFSEQVTVDGDEGRLRPDMVINLPSSRIIVVDSKTPMDAYLDAYNAVDDDARQAFLVRHAQSLRSHVAQLGRKAYWGAFDQSPEFVVMFLPNESVFSAALDVDPKLFEFATTNNVILATPSTLIAVLRASAQGWRHESVAREVKQVGELGRELYSRLSTMTDHVSKLGSTLTSSVKAYNGMIGSIESRVLPAARRFKELEVVGESKGKIDELEEVDIAVRILRAPDDDTLSEQELY